MLDIDTTPHASHVNSAWQAAGHAESMGARAIVLSNLAIAEAQHTANLIAAVAILPTGVGEELRRRISMRLGVSNGGVQD